MGVKTDIFRLTWYFLKYNGKRAKHRPTDIAFMEGWAHPPGSENDRRVLFKRLLHFIFEVKLDVLI